MYETHLFTKQTLFVIALLVVLGAQNISAQTTAFTYQGKLTDSGTPQSAYQMRFELYDALAGGNQVGATIANPSVAITQGVFTVQLDFGGAAFDGTNRFLEIAVRKTSGDTWTVLTTRQQISPAPYSIKSMNSTAADSLSAACVGCVQNANIMDVSGSKVTGVIPPESVPTGSSNYIQNAAAAAIPGKNSLQQAAGFNIDGNGVIGNSLGIGITPRAGIQLDVIGSALISPVGAGVMQFGNPNSETGMTTIVGSGRADLRFDGTTLKLVAGTVGAPPPSSSGITITTAGKVGIGTSAPIHHLSIVGGPLWTSNQWSGAVDMPNGSAIGWRADAGGWHFGIGQSDNGLYFFRTASEPGTTGSPANYAMKIADSGNLIVSGELFLDKLHFNFGNDVPCAVAWTVEGLVNAIPQAGVTKQIYSHFITAWELSIVCVT